MNILMLVYTEIDLVIYSIYPIWKSFLKKLRSCLLFTNGRLDLREIYLDRRV